MRGSLCASRLRHSEQVQTEEDKCPLLRTLALVFGDQGMRPGENDAQSQLVQLEDKIDAVFVPLLLEGGGLP